MNKLVSAVLGSLAVTLAAGVTLAQVSADLSLDPGRLYFKYWAPTVTSDEIHMLPNTEYNPLVLPCDLTKLGGQFDVHNRASRQPVYADVVQRLYHQNGQPIVSTSPNPVKFTDTNITPPVVAGGLQTAGYVTVDSSLNWIWQPSDLPANEPVRLELMATAYQDAAFTVPAGESNWSDNAQNIWIVRQCGCN